MLSVLPKPGASCAPNDREAVASCWGTNVECVDGDGEEAENDALLVYPSPKTQKSGCPTVTHLTLNTKNTSTGSGGIVVEKALKVIKDKVESLESLGSKGSHDT